MRKQSGYVYRCGDWWVLRYRENLVENGQKVRRHMARKIDLVQPEHQRLKRPPAVVLDKAQAMLAPVNSGSYKPEATQTLTEYVEQVYFPNLESQIRQSTLAGYRRRWESQLKARCGSYRLRDFRTPDGQKVLNEIARQDPTLLASTLHHLKSLLSGFFTEAIRLGILDGEVTISGTRKTVFGNPMRGVKIPKAPEGEETYAYGLEEVSRMLMYLPQPAYTVVALAAFTGLRRAELAGLEWQSYQGDVISVTRSVWEGHINPTKSKKSKAPVPVIAPLAKVLDIYREQCGNPTSGVMFASWKGTPLNLNNLLNRSILPVLKRAGVEWHGWHAFRRGLASNLYALGAPDKVIQSILRHANVAITMQCYVKTMPAQSVAAMKLLESALAVNCAQIPPAVVN